jgi:hypothetical protein
MDMAVDGKSFFCIVSTSIQTHTCCLDEKLTIKGHVGGNIGHVHF